MKSISITIFINASLLALFLLFPAIVSATDCSQGSVKCTVDPDVNGSDSCNTQCGSSKYVCDYSDPHKACSIQGAEQICSGNCKVITPTYTTAPPCASTSICYTGPNGADVAPGYACGSKDGGVSQTYVYGNNGDDNGHVLNCFTGICCDKGTPNPPLPAHVGSDLGADDVSIIDRCNPLSICYEGNYNQATLKPGNKCGNLDNWYYGHSDSGGVANCGDPGSGHVCCDTTSTSFTPAPPNPCPSQNGLCTKVDTALGTIDVSSPGAFVKTAFAVLLSISGAIALLIIVFSGYGIMTSQGDPEKLKGSREMLTSAIIGLLFLIFSVTILQIIGVDIFHIPGFTK